MTDTRGLLQRLPVHGFAATACLVAELVSVGIVGSACGSVRSDERTFSACGQPILGSGGPSAVATLEAGKIKLNDGSTTQSIGSDLILVLVPGCTQGAGAMITGPGRVRFAQSIRTADGRCKAIYISFLAGVADPRFHSMLTLARETRRWAPSPCARTARQAARPNRHTEWLPLPLRCDH